MRFRLNKLNRFIVSVFIGLAFLAACTPQSKKNPPFNPPAVIDSTPYVTEHLVRVPNGATALRPSF
ncbi:MAG: hypothetical protein ONA69_09895, partial [candidate division KSB1 bacterium]|nr:hypothetical protein [candidate division KSB1 bacterium]